MDVQAHAQQQPWSYVFTDWRSAKYELIHRVVLVMDDFQCCHSMNKPAAGFHSLEASSFLPLKNLKELDKHLVCHEAYT